MSGNRSCLSKPQRWPSLFSVCETEYVSEDESSYRYVCFYNSFWTDLVKFCQKRLHSIPQFLFLPPSELFCSAFRMHAADAAVPSGPSPSSLPWHLHTITSSNPPPLETGKMHNKWSVRNDKNKELNMCVYVFGNTRMCLWIKQGKCLLYFMCEMNNLERRRDWGEGGTSGASVWGRWMSGNAISFWCSSSSKQAPGAIPSG